MGHTKGMNQHVRKRKNALVAALDTLEYPEKLTVIAVIEAWHADEMMHSDEHKGSANCSCMIARVIRKLHGDPEPGTHE